MNSRRPHLIPCGHTLCLKCLTQLASQSRKNPKSIFCPFDKAEHKFTENVNKAFPVNFAILKGLEAFNKEKKYANVYKRYCVTHNSESLNFFCQTHDKLLC